MRVTLPRTPAAAPQMPAIAEVLKSKDVEDPVNLWVHRPLAYLFCRAVFHTRISPNQITLFSILLGLAASLCWVMGNSRAMVVGGVLLWASAIMDGADGILARARNAQSAFGRALDGAADWVVGLASVGACVFHLWQTGHHALLAALAMPTTLLTVLQFNLFDYYKEVFVHNTRLDRRREGHFLADVERMHASDSVQHGPWYVRWSMRLYVDYAKTQDRIIDNTNPAAHILLREGPRTEQAAELYRRENLLSMRIWAMLSTAPHAYLFSIFGMFDRLDLYIAFRCVVFGALTGVALMLQRRASERTLAAFRG
ncbi:MAG: CDP-alcohol phosphatidyltransferase family protein [Myxococcales bacterium]